MARDAARGGALLLLVLGIADLQGAGEYLGEHVAAGCGFGEGDPLEPQVDVALELFDGPVEDEVDVPGARVLVLLGAARRLGVIQLR